VVVRHARSDVTEEEILQWCDGRIASYKQPGSVTFIDEYDMPRTATGKILHRALRHRWPDNSD
jgi:acyl-coenzyme A synthetase/AMP-(fatty) acid ligase